MAGLTGGYACHTAALWQGWREGEWQVFDLVSKGGRVIEPARGVDARLDVVELGGRWWRG